mmetsp:Transcript_23034/g.43011  ORF Transcript_23034/g.43011 Transcript_23034/m.43011 type:complete len:212 (+) Transcript_23034:180-815(+)
MALLHHVNLWRPMYGLCIRLWILLPLLVRRTRLRVVACILRLWKRLWGGWVRVGLLVIPSRPTLANASTNAAHAATQYDCSTGSNENQIQAQAESVLVEIVIVVWIVVKIEISDRLDVAEVARDPCVRTWYPSTGASCPPRHDSDLNVVAVDQWTSRVALARILVLFERTGADHIPCIEVCRAKNGCAFGWLHVGDINMPQLVPNSRVAPT